MTEILKMYMVADEYGYKLLAHTRNDEYYLQKHIFLEHNGVGLSTWEKVTKEIVFKKYFLSYDVQEKTEAGKDRS